MFFRSLLFLTCMLIQGAISSNFNSCNEIKKRILEKNPSFRKADFEDGIYTLTTSQPGDCGEFGMEYQTYCDMTTDDAFGWTLIASIHENNQEGKCTVGDNWSSQQGNKAGNPLGDANWTNRKTFGCPVSATEADYKNPGYYDIGRVANTPVSLAVWHVPNKTPCKDWKTKSILRYHTTSTIPKNLFQTFTQYPLKRDKSLKCITNNGPSYPITYDSSFCDDDVNAFYGATTQAGFTPGFITFRAINTDSSVFAICSGTKPIAISTVPPKLPSCKPENHCVGGGGFTGSSGLDPKNCGDFSNLKDGVCPKSTNKINEAALLLFYK